MVRQALAEQSLQTYTESLLEQRAAVEVGLIIGHASPTRDFIFFVVKTPAQDGAEAVQLSQGATDAGAKKTSKGQAADSAEVTLDADWIGAHASQVAKMLPGGVSVLGFFLLATAAGFQGAVAALTRLAQALPPSDPAGTKGSDAAIGPLLLHIDAVSGKCAAKVVSSDPNAAPRPAELSFGPALSNFQAFATQFRLDADVPIPKGKDDLAGECDRLLQRELQRLDAAVVAVGERVLPPSQTVLEAFPSASGTDGPLHLTLFCPPTGHNHTGSPSMAAVGRLQLHGTVLGRAYVHRRSPATAAGAAVKADLVASLRVRLEALRDEAELMQTDGVEHPLLATPPPDAVVSPSLPVRVFLQTKAGLSVCENLADGETAEDAVARARELLGDQIAEDAAVTVGEGSERPKPADAPWDALVAPAEEALYVPQKPPRKPKTLFQIFIIWSILGSVLSVIGVFLAKALTEWIQSTGRDRDIPVLEDLLPML